MSTPPTTLNDVLDLARETLRIFKHSPLSEWLLAHLGEAQPCGAVELLVGKDEVIIQRAVEGSYHPDEADAIAAMLIRAAEDARAKAQSHEALASWAKAPK